MKVPQWGLMMGKVIVEEQWLSKLMVSQWGLIMGSVEASPKAGSSIVEEKQLSNLMAIQ